MRSWATKACDAVGVEPVTLHEARHCEVSFFIASGLDLKRTRTWAGHSDTRTTLNRYGHVIPGSEVTRQTALTAHHAAPTVAHHRESRPRRPPLLARSSTATGIRTRLRAIDGGAFGLFSGVSAAGEPLRTAGHPISTVAQLWRTRSQMTQVSARPAARILLGASERDDAVSVQTCCSSVAILMAMPAFCTAIAKGERYSLSVEFVAGG